MEPKRVHEHKSNFRLEQAFRILITEGTCWTVGFIYSYIGISRRKTSYYNDRPVECNRVTEVLAIILLLIRDNASFTIFIRHFKFE